MEVQSSKVEYENRVEETADVAGTMDREFIILLLEDLEVGWKVCGRSRKLRVRTGHISPHRLYHLRDGLQSNAHRE